MRILIVEDEVQLSEALGAILQKNNYFVDRVFNGEDGLDYILSDIYDVVILDIMLPKLNGLEVLKKARQSGISTPIILLTAKGEVRTVLLLCFIFLWIQTRRYPGRYRTGIPLPHRQGSTPV